MHLTIQQNSLSNRIRILLFDELSGRGKIGLNAHAKVQIAALRDQDSSPSLLQLLPWDGKDHLSGGFREIDPVAMPGLYEFALPDTLVAEGARRATIMVQAPGIRPVVIHLDLIAYNPYDGYRLGLECLTRESRHEVIARAFREVVPEIVEEFRGKNNL